MQVEKLTLGGGWRWMAGGYTLFRRNPMLLIGLSMGYWGILLMTGMLPLVGAVLGSLLAPGLSVGIMNACRQIDRGLPANVGLLFSAFRKNPQNLLALGALYLSATLAILFLTTLVDGGALMHLMTGKGDPDMLSEPNLVSAAQLAMLLMAPVIMAWWYAPILVCWDDTPLVKSLFFSFIACWRNWKAFLGYGAAGLLITLPPIVLIAMLAAGSGMGPGVLVVLLVPVALSLAPVFFASFYISYRDVFVNAPPAKPGVDLHA